MVPRRDNTALEGCESRQSYRLHFHRQKFEDSLHGNPKDKGPGVLPSHSRANGVPPLYRERVALDTGARFSLFNKILSLSLSLGHLGFAVAHIL